MLKGLYRLKNRAIFGLVIIFYICLSGCSCSSTKSGKKYYIGIDPTFYPLGLGPAENNVYGFSQELLLELAEELNLCFFAVRSNWDSLPQGLTLGNYDSMISSMCPYNFNLDKYNYSKVFLNTGFGLITRKSDKFKSLDEMKDKLVGYIRGEESILIIEKYPSLIVKIYDSLPVLLDDVNSGFLDGAVVDLIKGRSFVNNLYYDTLEIGSPLTDKGLRIVSLKPNESIIKIFDKGIEKIEKKGTLARLKKKWGLG